MLAYRQSHMNFLQWKAGLRRALVSDTACLLYLALLKLLLHLFAGANYGFFRDELYYIDAGKHLSAGYVEFPPLIGLLAACIHSMFGSVLIAYHVLPALAGACLVLLTGLIARELGGGRFAQCLAALASLAAPTFMGIDAIFSMDAFDELLWVLAAYVLILLIKREQPRLWLLFGLVAGIGLTNKITMLMFGFAIVVGLLLTPGRKYLWNVWAWAGGGLALAFLLPYGIWNALHGWPTLEFWSTYSNGHANPGSATDFFVQQVITMYPLTLPLWLAGLYYYFTREGKPYRVFACAFLVLYVLFTLSRAKLYFLSPTYPMLFAAGALLVERLAQKIRWLKPTYFVSLALVGLLLATVAMPLLPPAMSARVTSLLGINASVKVENRTTGQLSQPLADRFGWDSMTARVAQIYEHLAPAEREQVCILTENYGEAGAIDLYGPQYHLPTAISGHNTYYLWGPGTCTGKVVISIGYSPVELQKAFSSVTQAGVNTCDYCMPDENNLPIYVSRDLKTSIPAIWPTIKHYN